MTTYARIVGGQAIDVTTTDPAELFHPDVVAEFIEVPADTTAGDRLNEDGSWTKYVPEPITSVPVVLPMLTPMTFYLAFTPQERIAIKGSTDPLVKEFWASYELAVQLKKDVDPNLVSVSAAVAYLARQPADDPPGPGILASLERVQQILTGVPQ
jgi:hypothetical protein